MALLKYKLLFLSLPNDSEYIAFINWSYIQFNIKETQSGYL